MTTTQQATGAARKLARLAAVKGSGVQTCPYPPDSTGTRSAARRAWLTEYNRLRPAAVDYGDKVTALADGPDTRDTGAPAVPQPDLFTRGDA